MFYFRVTIVPVTNGQVTLSDDMLRLLVWVVADATMVDYRKYNGPTTIKRLVKFHLSKQRKIDELRALLAAMDVTHTFYPSQKTGLNKLQPYVIAIYGDKGRELFTLLNNKKQFPTYFKDLDHRQLMIVLNTIAATDGFMRWHRIDWSTINLADVQIIEYVCKKHKVPFAYKVLTYRCGFVNAKPQYKVNIALRGARRSKVFPSLSWRQ